MLIYMSMIEEEEDQTKFSIIYQQYRGLMFTVANQILKDEYEAEDVVHAAFMKIAKHIKGIQEPVSSRTKGYVVTITENCAIDVYRKKNRKKIESIEEMECCMPWREQESCGLAEMILKLPTKDREILMLKHYYGFSFVEIAQMMHKSCAGVTKAEQRARKKLEELCRKEGIL